MSVTDSVEEYRAILSSQLEANSVRIRSLSESEKMSFDATVSYELHRLSHQSVIIRRDLARSYFVGPFAPDIVHEQADAYQRMLRREAEKERMKRRVSLAVDVLSDSLKAG